MPYQPTKKLETTYSVYFLPTYNIGECNNISINLANIQVIKGC